LTTKISWPFKFLFIIKKIDKFVFWCERRCCKKRGSKFLNLLGFLGLNFVEWVAFCVRQKTIKCFKKAVTLELQMADKI